MLDSWIYQSESLTYRIKRQRSILQIKMMFLNCKTRFAIWQSLQKSQVMDMVKYYRILHNFLLKIPHRKIHKLQVCERNRFIYFNLILNGHVAEGDDNVQQISPLSGIDWVCFVCNKDLAEPGPKKGPTTKIGNKYLINLLHNPLTLVTLFIIFTSLGEELISIFRFHVT
jgi:hypothetical protein